MLKNKRLIIIFFTALIFRFAIIFLAHHGDLNNNISWGTLATQRGLNGFYEGEDWPYSAPNQPPLSILLFTGARVVWQTIENTSWWLNNNIAIFPSGFIWFWESKGMDLLVKLPSIVADLAIGYLVYRYFKEKKKEKLGITLAAVWLFNPVIWYNSTIWGQTDSIVNALGLIAIFFLLKRKLALFSVFLTLSFLFKGSLLIFVPVLFFVAVAQKYNIYDWIKSIIYSVITVIAVSISFHPKLDLFAWLMNLYKDRILPGEIGFLTANAFNFWWLVDSGRTLDSVVYFGLQARIWGFVVALGGMVAIIYLLSRKKIIDKRFFLSLVLVSLFTFLFMTRIHERYLYPFFPMATILLGFIPAMIAPYIILSAVHLLNLYHLFWAPSIAPLEALYVQQIFPQLLAIINIVVFVYLLRQVKAS